MIQSMTAFARSQVEGDFGQLVCEMRSINHRFLEISLHLPEMLRVLEMPLRERIRESIKRGKIECNIRYHLAANQTSMFNLNLSLVQELSQATKKIAAMIEMPAPLSPTDLLRFPGVLETPETKVEQFETHVFKLMDAAVVDMIAARSREGKELSQLFLQRLDLMMKELAAVRLRLPSILQEQHEKLRKRFHDAKIELDPSRLEQEMVLYAQKIDVAEEIERTETHINEIRRILKHQGPAGRRLDFLLQELNREANTLGSKSVDPVVTHAAIEMKVLIEQIREQVQNIE